MCAGGEVVDVVGFAAGVDVVAVADGSVVVVGTSPCPSCSRSVVYYYSLLVQHEGAAHARARERGEKR